MEASLFSRNCQTSGVSPAEPGVYPRLIRVAGRRKREYDTGNKRTKYLTIFIKDKQVIFTADIAAVAESQEEYAGKRVELSGYVDYVGFWASPYWNFVLKDENGVTIECYERNYHVDAWILPVKAVQRADRKDEKVTVVGRLEGKRRLELDWIEYEGQHYNTDYKPSFIGFPFM